MGEDSRASKPAVKCNFGPAVKDRGFRSLYSMRNALNAAAGIFCACLMSVLLTGQPLAAQTPPPDQQNAAQTPPATPPPPPPVVETAAPFYAGGGYSLTFHYRYGVGHPSMGTGHENGNGEPSAIDYLGNPRPEMGAVFSIPLGKHNAIRISFD